MTDAPASDDAEPAEPAEVDDVVDEHTDRFIDRFARGAAGATMGNAMLGLAKGMGLHHEREETVEIREADEPERDPDDPIEVSIDPDHPENSRIVFHLRRGDAEA
ncbi:MAG: hypothetical protein ACXVJ7_19480 [Acidimicrobiia bacterium]